MNNINKKKKLGQVFTPIEIAQFMSDLVSNSQAKTVLDPAVGQGIFIDCLEKAKYQNMNYTCYDIDKEVIKEFRKNISAPVNLFIEDYLSSFCENKFDIIICNPPYNKFQQIPNRNKYIANFREWFNIEMSSYSNLCVYFLIKSLHELTENGKCVYIIPYEFFNTEYGIGVKKYLLESKRLKAIYKFDSTIKLFDDAITTSCILFFDGNQNEKIDFIYIRSIDELETKKFFKVNTHSNSDINPNGKWNRYFSDEKKFRSSKLVFFKDIAQVKRGIATGNNKFFCLSRDQVRDLKISEESLVRCVTKSADVERFIFTREDFARLEKQNKKVFLFDGEKAKSEYDSYYINYGKAQRVYQGYLNSHKNPWYALEKRAPAPIWITVFSRNKLKIIRNESGVKNLTTFHGIYFNEKNEEYINLFFCYLLTPIGHEHLCINKRDYGNGLNKFEPNDLTNALILDLSMISLADRRKILYCYDQIKDQGVTQEILEKMNNIFLCYV